MWNDIVYYDELTFYLKRLPCSVYKNIFLSFWNGGDMTWIEIEYHFSVGCIGGILCLY